ncbi:MAG: photosynthetic complex assembly protein PuhC, partial [Hyphococcus sp.]
HGVGPDVPFELTRTEKGRLLLHDPATGRVIGLEAFGDDNLNDFARLLDQKDDANDA